MGKLIKKIQWTQIYVSLMLFETGRTSFCISTASKNWNCQTLIASTLDQSRLYSRYTLIERETRQGESLCKILSENDSGDIKHVFEVPHQSDSESESSRFYCLQ